MQVIEPPTYEKTYKITIGLQPNEYLRLIELSRKKNKALTGFVKDIVLDKLILTYQEKKDDREWSLL